MKDFLYSPKCPFTPQKLKALDFALEEEFDLAIKVFEVLSNLFRFPEFSYFKKYFEWDEATESIDEAFSLDNFGKNIELFMHTSDRFVEGAR